MTTAKTVFKNVFSLFMGSAVSQALRIVYMSILARYIGAVGFGQISTAAALVSLLILLVNFGLDTLVIRDVAGDRRCAAKYVGNVAFIRFLLTLVLAVVLAAIVRQSLYPYETKVIIAIYALVYVFDAFSDAARSIFHAFQKMGYGTVVDLARDFLKVAVSVLGIYLGWSLVAIVSVSAFASFFKLMVSTIVMQRRFVRPVLQIDLALCRTLFIGALPYFLVVCISVASERLIIVILSWIDTAEAVGIYSAATIPISALLMLPHVFMESIFPVFSQYHRISTEALGRSYRIAYKVMLLIGFPMGAGTILVSQDAMRLIYGPGFEDALLIMNILAIQLFTMVGYVNGAFLNATKRQTFFAILQLASVALKAILCYALIPNYRYTGAALAVAIPAIIDFGLYSVLCHRYVGLPLPWFAALQIGISTVVMGGSSYLALNHGASVFVVVLLAPALYLVSLVATRAVSAEEWQFINEIVFVKRLRYIVATLAGY